MRWEDERYVRLYTRDSATWAMLPWQGRCLLPLLLRKVDRAGVLEVVEGEEVTAIAELVKVPAEVVGPGLEALQRRGTVVIAAGKLRLPTFLSAQEARASDKIRQQKSRELAAMTQVVSHAVTAGHTPSHAVTDVTPSLAVPSLAVPSPEEDLPKPTRAPRKPSAAEEFFAWLAATRAGKTPLTEAKLSAQAINKIFGVALAEHGRGTCERAYIAFLALAEPGAMDPPWPRQSFIKRLPMLARAPASAKTRTITDEDLYADPVEQASR